MMETHKGKSIPTVKKFQIEGSWTPITPIKPTSQPHYQPIYENRQVEDYLSRFSQQNQAQTLLSYSITSADTSHIPTSTSNDFWDASNNGRINLEREHVEIQRTDLVDYRPRWNSQGRRKNPAYPVMVNPPSPIPSSFPFLSSWDSSSLHLRDNVMVNDSLDQYNNVSFADLLAMKDAGVGNAAFSGVGDAAFSGMGNAGFISGWHSNLGNCSSSFNGSSIFGNQNNLHPTDQEFGEIFGDVQSCASPHGHQSVCDANSPLITKHANGKNSTFTPTTPDLRWRMDPNVGSANSPLGNTYQGTNEQTGFQEQDAAAVMVNLNAQEVTVPNTDASPGKVSMAVENHDPDKGGNQVIDLNKTPQKKPRRRRYQPKVLSEKKPKRTPKPFTPKPSEPKETTRAKRKYVRKNKEHMPSATPAEATEAGEPNLAGETEADPKPIGESDEVGDTKLTRIAARSCRRSLNFDLNGQATENGDSFTEQQSNCHAAGDQYSHTVHPGQGEESMVETSRGSTAYDLNHIFNQELNNYLSLPTKDFLDNSKPDVIVPSRRKENVPHSLPGNIANISSRNSAHPTQSPNSSPCASSNEQEQTRGSKRSNSYLTNIDAGRVAAANCTLWQPNHAISGKANIGELHKFLIPEICKKKRTEKLQRLHILNTSSTVVPSKDINQVAATQNHPQVDPTASKYYCNPAPFSIDAVTTNDAKIYMGNIESRAQLLNTWADMARLKKKKRSKGTTRVRDLATLKGIANPLHAKPGPKGPRKKKIDNSEQALVAESTTKPKSKRRSRKQNSFNKQWDLVLYNGNPSNRKATGFPALPWARASSVEDITEGLKQLDINKEGCSSSHKEQNALVPYRANKQEQNALVLYGADGTIVPFDGPFNPIRKRRQRAKVDLDGETTKVWKLLLENIDNKGIDGTDEDKAKWWENERSIFRGRVDSFIARMRLVQGDRRFTPWKGSVLDSVIGVFLTQNVSDHLSSSAFMSLAAHFPLKSEGSESTLSEESATALFVEPDAFIIEPEESITWSKKTMDEQILIRNSRIIHDTDHSEEKEVVNSKELNGGSPGLASPKDYSSESGQAAPNTSVENNTNSQTTETETASILGDDRAKDDATSSQQSVVSSQNSTNSPNLQTIGIMSIFSESDSRTQPPSTSSTSNYFDCSTSFLGLLKMAESPFFYESYSQTPQEPIGCLNHVTKDSPEAQGVCSSNYQLNLNFQLAYSKGIEMLELESKTPDTSTKDENSSPTEQSILTTESTAQHLAQEKSSDSIPRSITENMPSCYVLEGEKMVMQSPWQSGKETVDGLASPGNEQTSSTWKSTNLSQVTADVTESTTESKRTGNEQKEIMQSSVQTYASGGITDVMNASKSRKGKAGKGKNDAYDWDSLRQEAQPNGRKKERTANTRDSIDWEAVRHADVSEIAETIKERGMNNMLAERIKDLLDRLVKDHGSIDMEWLRDIPPDKAKEYLLSFRGLGLKSVECVRLLTLHHLAFPVDTNVGRIAVRLGWVPLQPLPESLQLHLLELYPVLESIQKYLWPRLCKLDQKTLYELHYHLITFGKVFCTKRQPNCNSCPLRGECRHFASAFASARFALPGTEEKSIMPSNGAGSTHPNPQASINLLPLPPSWSNQHSQSNPRCLTGAPKMEVAASSLALPLPQTINHIERQSEIRNCEPIVEVPASPEPEPEQEHALFDIEDGFYEDPDEIPTIQLNMKEFTQNLQYYMQANKELQETGMSNALVALTPEAASIPTPKLKNISRLRTEHHVYELPDTHPLLKGMDKREPDDPCSYLLAIWTPGETPDSIQPPERKCSSEDPSLLCNEETCSYCNSQREANSQIVRGTLLMPCRTAMRGSFPLNGTYFQVNEVFADHDSSLNPIAVPRTWLWNLPRRTVYFGTSIPTIFRGLTTEDIQHCFWRGFVCVRGFDQKSRAPRPLMARLHFPASRMNRGAKDKTYDE